MNKDLINRLRWESLIASDEGRWLLRNLISKSCAMHYLPYQGGSGADASSRGKQDFIQLYVCDPLRKQFGWGIFDKIMEKGSYDE